MTEEEQENVELVKLREKTHNGDIERFVYECYAADCDVNGGFIRGQEQLFQVERNVLLAAPKRRMRIECVHATRNVVVVQAVLLDPEKRPGWRLPFCAVLTCRDGKIVTDWTCADFSKWPGLDQPRRARGVAAQA